MFKVVLLPGLEFRTARTRRVCSKLKYRHHTVRLRILRRGSFGMCNTVRTTHEAKFKTQDVHFQMTASD